MSLADAGTMLTRLLVSALISVGLCPRPACAAPAEGEPVGAESASVARSEKAAAGSHFLAEGSAGFGVSGTSGFTWGGVLGAGGRVPYTPLRLYLVGELLQSTSDPDANALDDYEAMDVSLGLRGYIPVYGRLRLFADGLLGRTRHTSSREAELGRVSAWTDLLAAAAGLQLRVVDQLSCGVRGRVALARPSDAFGSPTPRQRWSVGATLTAHF